MSSSPTTPSMRGVASCGASNRWTSARCLPTWSVASFRNSSGRTNATATASISRATIRWTSSTPFASVPPGDTVLDPACGSGSFLVRAYYRKRHLDARRPHLDLIGELFRLRHCPVPGPPGDTKPGRPRNQRRSELSAHRPPQFLRHYPRAAFLPSSRQRLAGIAPSCCPILTPSSAIRPTSARKRWRKMTRRDSARLRRMPGPTCD